MIQYLAPYTTVYHYLMFFQDLFSFSTNPNVLGRDLGVSHADELSYMWDLFGLNAGTGVYDAWWSEANKLNSKRYQIIGHQKHGIFCTTQTQPQYKLQLTYNINLHSWGAYTYYVITLEEGGWSLDDNYYSLRGAGCKHQNDYVLHEYFWVLRHNQDRHNPDRHNPDRDVTWTGHNPDRT